MKNLKTDPIAIGSSMLLIGIGNSGRGDDGLGWEFVERVNGLGYDFLDYEFRYQLQVEDAELIAKYDVVVFVDASRDELDGGFEMRRCISASHSFYTTHSQSPEAILHLASNLYNKFPKAYTLAISGKEWHLQTLLSFEAKNNLQSAFTFFVEDFLPTVQPVIAFNY
jgi:hydrogenase maturation protease